MSRDLFDLPCLLVDDNREYIESFTAKAELFGIKVNNRTNLEEMKQFLYKYRALISSVILDVKCLLTASDEYDDESFITEAINFLNKYYSDLQFFVLTADSGRQTDLSRYYRNLQIFLKTPEDEDKLIAKIKNLTENYEQRDAHNKFGDIYDIIKDNQYNLEDYIENVNYILINRHALAFPTIKESLTKIRNIVERILRNLSSKRPDIIPEVTFFPDGENSSLNFSGIHNHLNGNPIFPKGRRQTTSDIYIQSPYKYELRTLYDICSSVGSHDYVNTNTGCHYNYTLKACIYMLFDIIYWYKLKIDEKQN